MSFFASPFTLWTTWFLASFFYAYQYVLRVLPNLMMEDILQQFHIDAALFGQLSGVYYIGYALMHIPIGILLDRFGPKWVLPGCMLLSALGLVPLLYSEHWVYPLIGRILVGIGSSGAILGVFKIIRLGFKEERFAFTLGCSVTLGLIGAIYGGQPVNYLLHSFGTAGVLYGLIFLGIVLAIATAWLVPSQDVNQNHVGLFSIKTVLTHPQVLLVCIFSGFMVGPLEGFADVWGKQYLETVYHLSETLAASFPSLIFLGMCFGSPLLSALAEKTRSYLGLIALSALTMGIAFSLILSGRLPLSALPILFFIIGLFSAYQILAIYQASTYLGTHLAGLTTACANMIIMIFGYVFHSSIGKIMTLSWDGKTKAGAPLYDATAFYYGLGIIPVALFIATLVFCVLWLRTSKETKNQFKLGS